MITKEVYRRNKSTKDLVWVYLNYNPEEENFSINAGYYYSASQGPRWYSEQKEYELNDYLKQFPEWENAVTVQKEEIETELFDTRI